MARFQGEVQREEIPDVCFVGLADSGALARYYQSSSVVCVPSLGSESFGIVLLEAMAAGKPVVASAISGYREVVEDGKQGQLVPPGSVDRLTDALDELLGDDDLRAALGQAGSETARRYAWPRVADQITRAYASAANRRRATMESSVILGKASSERPGAQSYPLPLGEG